MAKKLKDMVKKNPVANPTFGTDPSNPWATKYNVTEASETELLARYLNSRGINPHFVSRDTKIAHAKSAEYAKWKADHTERFAREETEQLDELSPATMASYILKTSGKDPKRADPRKKIMSKLAKAMAKRPANPNAPRFSTNVFGEGFDDPKEIAKELVKRHGKNVTKQHVRDIEGERDTRSSLDHDEVMAHVKKLNEAKKLTSLDKFRRASAEREKKHAEIEKQSKEKPDMKGAIDRLEKHLNKEETINEVSSSEVEHHFNNWTNSEHAPYNSDAGDDNKVHQSALRYLRSTNVPKEKHEKLAMHIAHKFHGSGIDEASNPGISKTKETSFHKKLDKLVHSTFGKRKDEMKMKEEVVNEISQKTAVNYSIKRLSQYIKPTHKSYDDTYKTMSDKHKSGMEKARKRFKEETEQIDELKKDTLKSYRDKSMASLKNAKINRSAAEPGKDMSKGFADLYAKSDSIAKKRAKGLAGYLQRKHGMKPGYPDERKTTSEDAFQDTYAATQMPFDGANTTNDTSMKREMSKSARIIKSIYKRKNMKEELADWEKEDKSVQTYGKKPKLDMTDKKSNIGENKPEARAVMTGGKTLTGQDRDMVEIDPAMKNRPDKPDTFDKGYPKKSPA